MRPEIKALIEHHIHVEGMLFASTYRSPQAYEHDKLVATAKSEI